MVYKTVNIVLFLLILGSRLSSTAKDHIEPECAFEVCTDSSLLVVPGRLTVILGLVSVRVGHV